MSETSTAATADQLAEHEHADHAEAIAFAHQHGLHHERARKELVTQWAGYPFGVGNWRRARNVVHGELADRSMIAFDYHYVTYSDDEEHGYERDALHRFLVCVINLSGAKPDLSAVRTEWLEWHPNAVEGSIIDVGNEAFARYFTLFGADEHFAGDVVTDERAARCAEVHSRAEWRFDGDELVIWVKGGRVGEQLHRVLEAVGPLIEAAESYQTPATIGAAGSAGSVS